MPDTTLEPSLGAQLRAYAKPLPSLDDETFADAFDAFGDAQVVLLGEATHGTSEFYRARAAITRRLVERHGFRIVAVEADWPDMAELDRFVRNRGAWGQQDSFVNFPRWMWRNEEFRDFIHSLRAWNLPRAPAERVELRGLDVYSLTQSVAEVLKFLDLRDPVAAAEARRRYGCLTPFLDEPQAYGAAARFGQADCEDAVVSQLVALLQHRTAYASRDGEAYFDAAQNARVVRSAEGYYRAMYRGSVESWNLRDGHMFDTLKRLLDARGEGARAVVWAHNSHIGDASATAMGEAGEYNLGQLCRAEYGRDCVAIGFGTDRGLVVAADDWGVDPRLMQIQPCRRGSWEHAFLEAGCPRSLTSWRFGEEPAQLLRGRRLERAIGVIYRPQSELRSHYFEASLPGQFDAYVWFEETGPVSPLAGAQEEGAVDLYPFGV